MAKNQDGMPVDAVSFGDLGVSVVPVGTRECGAGDDVHLHHTYDVGFRNQEGVDYRIDGEVIDFGRMPVARSTFIIRGVVQRPTAETEADRIINLDKESTHPEHEIHYVLKGDERLTEERRQDCLSIMGAMVFRMAGLL
jgi:hypothetical protein